MIQRQKNSLAKQFAGGSGNPYFFLAFWKKAQYDIFLLQATAKMRQKQQY